MATYLSIDLDFWCHCHRRRRVDSFFKKVYALGLPIYTVSLHHHLLKHINKSKYDQIINVDYHSDLCDLATAEDTRRGYVLFLDEGSWANFVNHRTHFIWRLIGSR